MRPLVLLAFCLPLVLTSTVDARLFWQTYGSTIPSGDGCGSTWNWNQDYFVPRHTSSCRYGLFSPCKTSHTKSPACVSCHPFYPGYCGVYGDCHYRRRDRVYGAYCGCTALQGYCGPWRNDSINDGCATSACCQSGSAVMTPTAPVGYLPNVETTEFVLLGSISVEGDGLLANLDLTPAENLQEEQVFLGPTMVEPNKTLPNFGKPQSEKTTQPLPSP